MGLFPVFSGTLGSQCDGDRISHFWGFFSFSKVFLAAGTGLVLFFCRQNKRLSIFEFYSLKAAKLGTALAYTRVPHFSWSPL